MSADNLAFQPFCKKKLLLRGESLLSIQHFKCILSLSLYLHTHTHTHTYTHAHTHNISVPHLLQVTLAGTEELPRDSSARAWLHSLCVLLQGTGELSTKNGSLDSALPSSDCQHHFGWLPYLP